MLLALEFNKNLNRKTESEVIFDLLSHIGSLFLIRNKVRTRLALALGLRIGFKKSKQIKTVSKITFKTQIVFRHAKNADNNHLASIGHHTEVEETINRSASKQIT